MNSEIKGKKWHVVSFTHSGKAIADCLKQELNIHQEYDKYKHVSLGRFVEDVFELNGSTRFEGLLFIGAAGIAVRSIAPFIKDKVSDPPVIVIDDQGFYIISLLSGHLGGANLSAKWMSLLLKPHGYHAEPVITTATDIRGLLGIEEILKRYNVPIEPNRESIKKINMHIANGGQLRIEFDPLLTSEGTIEFEANHGDGGMACVGIALRKPETWIGNRRMDHVFYSKTLVVGTGCKKGLDFQNYKTELLEALDESGFSIESVGIISSISIKSEEPCLIETSEWLQARFICHDVNILKAYEAQFEGSDFVKKQVGVSAVAGPSAMVISEDHLAQTVYKKTGCTFAFGRMKK
ncbi:MAG: cobalamin biosynthesis protein [Clostridia bacterium]|nr:cobalamin biosynthesis protein [Clostridia bacterium]